MSPTEKIIDKLKKLQAMADGAKAIGNEAEAQAFAEMFEKLLTRHKLDLSDIDFVKLEEEEPVGEHYIDWANHPDFKVKRASIQWQSILAQIVAQAHYCEIVRFTGSNRFYIVGRKSDAEVAEYAIITLIRAAGKIAAKEHGIFYRQCHAAGQLWKAAGYRDAFLLGFINRLKERYDELKAGHRVSTSTALVRIERERKAVNDFMAAMRETGKTRALASRKRWQMNEHGRRRGREVADSVNLGGKAIKSGNTRGEFDVKIPPYKQRQAMREATLAVGRKYIVMCQVSGGVTGTRQASLKNDDTVRYFDTREKAQAKATELNAKMNNAYSVAFFKYWVEEV